MTRRICKELGVCSAFMAELWVYEGLRIAIYLGVTAIEVTVDSIKVVNAIKNRSVHNMGRSLINKFQSLLEMG